MLARTPAVMAASVLLIAGCSSLPFGSDDESDEGPDVESMDYCERVEHFEDQVRSIGAVKTDEAFAEYVVVLETIAESAPSEPYEAADTDDAESPTARSDWNAWAELTEGFLTAHQEIDFPLADRYDPEKVDALSDEEKTTLNNATYVYNVGVDTLLPRVSAQLQSSCTIDLGSGAPNELDEPVEDETDDAGPENGDD